MKRYIRSESQMNSQLCWSDGSIVADHALEAAVMWFYNIPHPKEAVKYMKELSETELRRVIRYYEKHLYDY